MGEKASDCLYQHYQHCSLDQQSTKLFEMVSLLVCPGFVCKMFFRQLRSGHIRKPCLAWLAIPQRQQAAGIDLHQAIGASRASVVRRPKSMRGGKRKSKGESIWINDGNRWQPTSANTPYVHRSDVDRRKFQTGKREHSLRYYIYVQHFAGYLFYVKWFEKQFQTR